LKLAGTIVDAHGVVPKIGHNKSAVRCESEATNRDERVLFASLVSATDSQVHDGVTPRALQDRKRRDPEDESEPKMRGVRQ
jgi:hypothetical protein